MQAPTALHSHLLVSMRGPTSLPHHAIIQTLTCTTRLVVDMHHLMGEKIIVHPSTAITYTPLRWPLGAACYCKTVATYNAMFLLGGAKLRMRISLDPASNYPGPVGPPHVSAFNIYYVIFQCGTSSNFQNQLRIALGNRELIFAGQPHRFARISTKSRANCCK